MAESTILKDKQEGTVQFGDGGAGAWNDSTGAALGSNQYTVAFEPGDFTWKPPRVGPMTNVLDRDKITDPPSLVPGAHAPGEFSFSAYFRDLTDASSDTLMDILMWCSGNAPSGSAVATNWESTSASSLGAGDAKVTTVGLKFTVTNAGSGADTHIIAWNFCEISDFQFSEDYPNKITISGKIHDKPDSYYRA